MDIISSSGELEEWEAYDIINKICTVLHTKLENKTVNFFFHFNVSHAVIKIFWVSLILLECFYLFISGKQIY